MNDKHPEAAGLSDNEIYAAFDGKRDYLAIGRYIEAAVRAALSAEPAPETGALAYWKNAAEEARIERDELRFAAAMNESEPAPPPADPLETPLPCDVTIGNGTHRKGTPLGTLVRRMQWVHRELYSDPPSPEEADRNLAALLGREPAPPPQEPDCWAVLTPNGSRLVSPDEAKGMKGAYPLYARPQEPKPQAAADVLPGGGADSI